MSAPEPVTPSIERTPVGETSAKKPVALQLYTMPEVAAQFRVSRRWLQDFIKIYPFYRIAGRLKVFSPTDIQRLYEALPRPPSSRIFIPSMIRSGVRTPDSEWDEALKLVSKGKRKRLSAASNTQPESALTEALRLATEKSPRSLDARLSPRTGGGAGVRLRKGGQ
jgi:hypothetical protein